MTAPEFTFTGAVAPICQIGMSANRQPEPDSWLDVSCYVHQVEAFRGRDRFTDRFQPGTAAITFSNEDGWGDLVGVGPAVAAETLRPGRPIRVGLTGTWIDGVATRWLFRGWVDQCVPRYDPVEHDVVDVNCIDALGESGSQPAPRGPFQGANELVNARINRVLDAVGWFAPKRKVSASATTVQGTELGSQGVDLMGVAADSAGGVVFGDLDGDVVFRDLDWELYDPDTPPDGTIGNVDPGTPGIPYTPGYLDPAVGYVYWTDPPPLDRPMVLRVCATAGDGSLVAQGDLNLSVVNGQLRFESLGHVWNMGGYDGGCIEIASCTPEDPTTPPTRYDLSSTARTDTWVPHPELPTEVLPTPPVELLHYTDAGLSDPPAASITPGPLEPGPGGLLVVLFNAIGSATVDPRLDATLSGGGLSWQLVDHADAWDGGASSWIWVTEVGRSDPGLFSLSISWTGTIRSHACTVWRVRKYANDYMAQVAAGFANRAVTHSDGILEVIQPGDGPQAITLAAVTSPTDVTIAQTLAEEGTPPYGAVFDDIDGVWTVPPLTSHLPPVALRAVDAEAVCDDFERADGPLGADWQLGPGPGSADEVTPLAISSGAAVGTANYVSGAAPYISNSMSWSSPADPTATQSIEVTVENIWTGLSAQYCALLTNMTTGSKTSQFADFQFGTPGAIVISAFHFDADGNSSSPTGSVLYPHATSEPITLRLESDPDGTQRIYVDDVLALESIDPAPVTGSLVGMSLDNPDGTTSPRILEACIGGTGGAHHKTSWVAGWRTDAISSTVAWSDVNTGPTNLQSSQAALVVDGDRTGDTPADDDLVIGGGGGGTGGGGAAPFTGDIFDVERREGCDPYDGDVVWLFDPSTGGPWADFTPSDPDAIVPPGPGTPVRPGDACPQTWDEAADRSQMTTQVMIGRQSPSNIPPLTYNFPGANPPTAGQIVLNAAQSEATVMRVHKTMNTGADATLWLRYLHANDRVRFADADDTGVAIGYALTAEPAESATYFDLPIIWQDGQTPVPAGGIALTLTLLPQPPHLFYDAFGVPIYGVETLSRTDLINTSDDLLPTLADRILEVRGSNSIPRVETVTLDARTGGFNQPTVMHLMSTAAPERPSRYRMRLQVNERPIFDRMCFVNSVRHFVSRDEWTVRLALDVAEWAAQL